MSETALTVHQGGAMVAAESAGDAFLAMSERASRDPEVRVDKMREMLEMRERIMKYDAEVEFSRAMKAAQSEMQPVVRDAQNQHTRSMYAKLETIDANIRPIYTKHGFSLSFNSGEPRSKDAVRVLCDVRHEAGHTKPYELEGDLDMTGAKGTSNKTSIQGLGSSVSYLRRYLTCMIFNVTLMNEDKDGVPTGLFINEEQVQNIATLLHDCGISETSQEFLAWAGADKIEHINKIAYERVKNHLVGRLPK